MLFNSLTFFYFFLVVLAGNYALPQRVRNAWILGASFIFYMSFSPAYILLLLVTAFVDYIAAQKMGERATKAERRPWLIVSLAFNLASLGFFKYTDMAIGTIGDLAQAFGSAHRPSLLHIALPLGISFYTFETISYGVDVYRGEIQPKKSFFEYLSFLMFFPKLIAGPIVRASELLPQIRKERSATGDEMCSAVNLILSGFIKKVLLADNFAPFVEQVFANPSAHNRWMCIVAAYGYSMQVYFDFSAYSDIARGCARLLGYELPLNFNQPYLAVSIADYWRRWHMTLSRWLGDYLYKPLGGNRGGRFLTYRNLFLTMLLGGLWHGAAWTFVIWGAMNGVFLLVERAWHDARGTKPKSAEELGFVDRWARRFVVFHLITLTRVFFRAPTFAIAIDLLRTIARPLSRLAEPSLALFLIPIVSLAYISLAFLKPRLHALRPSGPVVVAYGFALVGLLVFGASQAEFIYFQF